MSLSLLIFIIVIVLGIIATLAIAYAVDHGATGASAAWTRLTSATNWSDVESSGFDDIPIWGVVPRSSTDIDMGLKPKHPENFKTV